MLYSRQFKCRYLNIPGCGGNLFSSKLRLQEYSEFVDYDYSFGLIRNPLDRVASIYSSFDDIFKLDQTFFDWIKNGNIAHYIPAQHTFNTSGFDMGRFEDIHGDTDDFWYNVCCELYLQYRPFKKPIKWAKRNYYNVHYDAHHANIVAEIFKEDMETFNYTIQLI